MGGEWGRVGKQGERGRVGKQGERGRRVTCTHMVSSRGGGVGQISKGPFGQNSYYLSAMYRLVYTP